LEGSSNICLQLLLLLLLFIGAAAGARLLLQEGGTAGSAPLLLCCSLVARLPTPSADPRTFSMHNLTDVFRPA